MASLLYSCLVVSSLLSLLNGSWALRNVTVDDSDRSIEWFGKWARTPRGFGHPYGGTYMATKEKDAYAEFKFTGVAIYFVSPRFPATASSRLVLDPSPDSTPLTVNLEDYDTKTTDREFERAMVLASATGLENREHTVRVEMGGEEGTGVFDAFVYTILEDDDTPPPASGSPAGFTLVTPYPITLPSTTAAYVPSPSTGDREDSSASKPDSGIIIASTLGSVFFLVIIALICRTSWSRLRPQPRAGLTTALDSRGVASDLGMSSILGFRRSKKDAVRGRKSEDGMEKQLDEKKNGDEDKKGDSATGSEVDLGDKMKKALDV